MKINDADGKTVLDIIPDDSSYGHRAIMDEDTLTLFYSLAEHLELPLGAYVEFGGRRYTLMRPEAIKMQHTRQFDYTVTFDSEQEKAKMWKVRNPIDGRIKFPYTATPLEHLRLMVDNLNLRDSGWAVGDCIDGVETLISYDNAYIWDGLTQIAQKFGTEFSFDGKTVSLCKLVRNRDNPLPMAYGRGKGFLPGVGRSNGGQYAPAGILFAQGGDRNLDPSKYGSKTLLLPKGGSIRYDGSKFEDEKGFDPSKAETYTADAKGFSVRRTVPPSTSNAEDTLDCSSIYPSRVGTISKVMAPAKEGGNYRFTDADPESCPDFSKYVIAGETMTVIFQSGELSGREFDVAFSMEKDVKGGGKDIPTFEIIPNEQDGLTMPGGTYVPKGGGLNKDGSSAGDRYAVFHCALPQKYINAYDPKDKDSEKKGAEWDMMRAAVRRLYESGQINFTFSGTMDGLWAKKDWENIGGRLVLGGYIKFSAEFLKEAVDVRITGLKVYVNNPHSPEIELSNGTQGGSFAATLQSLKSTEVLIDHASENDLNFTKRRWRDAKETMEMLKNLKLPGFDDPIHPITIQTMQLLAGDESLQFRFVDSYTDPHEIEEHFDYDPKTKTLKISKDGKGAASVLQHMTLGIKDISPSHKASEYKFWEIPSFTSGTLDDPKKKYYLYAVCPDTENGTLGKGQFRLSESGLPLKDGTTYNLLVGLLDSESDGTRSFTSLYGFTEILPGRVTTDRVVSSDGGSWFDLVQGAMNLGDRLKFNVDGNDKLVLNGTFVQSGDGKTTSALGCYRGEYDPGTTYYDGDEVSYTNDGITSTYRFTSSTPKKGAVPGVDPEWTPLALGADGTSVLARYSADGKSWHDELQPGDTYWSTSSDGGKTWSAANRFAGEDGKNGIPGKNGTSVGISSTDYAYAVSTQGTTPPTSGWSDKIPTVPQGSYLWGRTTVTFTDGKSTVAYSVSRQGVNGTNGHNGTDGKNGKDGTSVTITSTSVEYALTSAATQPTSGWTSAMPSLSLGKYLWTRTIVEYSDGKTTTSYSVSRLGTDGVNGQEGQPGTDGKTSYVHFAYAMSADGKTEFSRTPYVGAKYIGVYSDHTEADSGDYTRYKWSELKGEKGEKGDTTYFHIKYAPSADPTAAQMSETPDVYIGTYVDTIKADSDDPKKYTWARLEGIQGKDGIPGKNGTNGETYYLHIKYSDDGGKTFTADGGEKSGKFIGVLTDRTKRDSDVPSEYTWSLIKGADGHDGKWLDAQWALSTDPTKPPTSGWASKPQTAKPGEYVWLRRGWVTPPATAPTEWMTPVRLTGDRGSDGQTTYLLTCDNEMQTVVCDNQGFPKDHATPITAKYTVWGGASEMSSGVQFSIDYVSGVAESACSISYYGDLTIDPSGVSTGAQSALVTVQAVVSTDDGNAIVLRSVFTLAKVIPGHDGVNGKNGANGHNGADGKPGKDGHNGVDGKSATVYALVPSKQFIKKDMLGDLHPTELTFQEYKVTGEDERTAVHTHDIYYQQSGVTPTAEDKKNGVKGLGEFTLYTGAIKIRATATDIIGELRDSTGEVLDRQTVPMLDDISDMKVGGANLLTGTNKGKSGWEAGIYVESPANANWKLSYQLTAYLSDSGMGVMFNTGSFGENALNQWYDNLHGLPQSTHELTIDKAHYILTFDPTKTPPTLNEGYSVLSFDITIDGMENSYYTLNASLLGSDGGTVLDFGSEVIGKGKTHFAKVLKTKKDIDFEKVQIFLVPRSEAKIYVAVAPYAITVANLMLQRGNVETDWTPSSDERYGSSPALVYRGDYDSSKTYYGNDTRVDCVKYGNQWYVASTEAGQFSGQTPSSSTKWKPFGASFESVATSLLLAENANIGGWIFRNGRLESQTRDANGNPMAFLDGTNGTGRLQGVLQQSTSYGGKIGDSNIFYLPAVSQQTKLTLPTDAASIGKVIKIYNSSTDENGVYVIQTPEQSDSHFTGHGFNEGNQIQYMRMTEKLYLGANEYAELTCFQAAADKVCWVITGRYGNQERHNESKIGHYAPVIAIGSLAGGVVGNDKELDISGHWWDGHEFLQMARGNRQGVGVYQVLFNTAMKGDYLVLFGGEVEGVYGTLSWKDQYGFKVSVYKNGRRADELINFIIFLFDYSASW